MTITGDLLGTLRYMSPEQALAKRITVDHRTDIYSLGITLYELLALQPAFDGADREEVLRQIAFEEPIAPRKLNPAIPLDLETIVLKAIEKNPLDRYATAGELAEDLRRFLAHEPIHARHPSAASHAWKWVRRHPGVLASSILVLLVALAAAIVAAGIANTERGKTRLALDEKGHALARAEANQDLAVGAVDAMYAELAMRWIANETAPTAMQQHFLQQALSFYQQTVRQPRTTEYQKIRAARIYERIGRIQLYLGNPMEAAEALRESIAIVEDLVIEQPNRVELQISLPKRYRALGEALVETADLSAAEEAYRAGIGYLDMYAKSQPSVETIIEQVEFDHCQADLWIRTHDLDRAEAAVRTAAKRIAPLRPTNAPPFLDQQNGYFLARVLHAKGDEAKARDAAQKALDGCRGDRLQTHHDARGPAELEVALLELLGEISEAQGSLEEAVDRYRETLNKRVALFKSRRPPVAFITLTMINATNSDGQYEHGPFCRYVETQYRLARVLRHLGRPKEAEDALGDAMHAAVSVWADRQNVLRYQIAHANGWAMAADLLREQRPAEAEPALAHAMLIWQDILALFPNAGAYRSGVHGHINDLDWFRTLLSAEAAQSLSARRASLNDRVRWPVKFPKDIGDRYWRDAFQDAERRKIAQARSSLYRSMSHAVLGEQTEARGWFDKATAAIQSTENASLKLIELRNEAQRFLGNAAPQDQ